MSIHLQGPLNGFHTHRQCISRHQLTALTQKKKKRIRIINGEGTVKLTQNETVIIETHQGNIKNTLLYLAKE